MIGIFGGTFDPIHIGHLRTAADVQQALALEQVRLIPLQNPPHRTPPIASDAQRLAMLQTAVEANPGFVVDQRELERSGKSYTVDTLRSLKAELPHETLCLLIGSDAFSHFPQWQDPEEILHLAHVIVMHRPTEPVAAHYLDRQTDNPQQLNQSNAGQILSQTVTQLDISSSKIREMLMRGESPRYLLPEKVLEIIQNSMLYR